MINHPRKKKTRFQQHKPNQNTPSFNSRKKNHNLTGFIKKIENTAKNQFDAEVRINLNNANTKNNKQEKPT